MQRRCRQLAGVVTLNSWATTQCGSLASVADLLATEPSQDPLQLKKMLAAALTSQPTWQGLYLVDEKGRRVIGAATAAGSKDLSTDLTDDKSFSQAGQSK